MTKRFASTIVFSSIFLACALFFGCGNSASAPAAATKKSGPKFPVEVALVQTRSTEFSVRAVGSVEAYEIVQVTARVPGIVRAVKFIEGDDVKRDAALLEIEPERYRLALQSAEAQYQKACAGVKESRAGLLRREDMLEQNPGFVSKEELENWQTRTQSLEADSAQAAASLEISRLNLRDAFAPAPVGGVIQTRNVQTGQYLQTGTVVATLVRRDPLLLKFDVPEQDAGRISAGQQARFTVRGVERDFSARVSAVGESADPATRMVAVTAEVNDKERNKLRPGSFAEVTVFLGTVSDLPIIPQISIRPSERGFLAYVVKDSVAQERVLSLGMQTADGFVEVKSGVDAGELIVVRGAEALRDKAGVRVVEARAARESAAKDSSTGSKS